MDLDVKETISLVKEVKPDFISLSILSPYYGSKIYKDLVSQGYPLDKTPEYMFYHQTGELMVNNTISKEVLQEYLDLNEMNKGKGYI